MSERKERCETCKWYRPGYEEFEPEMTIQEVREEEEISGKCGYCMRYPPVAQLRHLGNSWDTVEARPMVYLDEYCGEWTPVDAVPKTNTPIDAKEWSVRAINWFFKHGIETLEQLCEWTADDITRSVGRGKSTYFAECLKETLAKKGLSLKKTQDHN